MTNKTACPGCKGDPNSRPFEIGWPFNKTICLPCSGNDAPSLRNLKIWDNTRYTLKDACTQLEQVKGIDATKMETEVQALINAPLTMPIKEVRKPGGTVSPTPLKKKLSCDCVNPAARGVCVLGACVNVSEYGWSITVNDSGLNRTRIAKEKTSASKWPETFRPEAPPSIYRGITVCFCNRSNKNTNQGTLSTWQVNNPNASVGIQPDGTCRLLNGTITSGINLGGGDGKYMVLNKGGMLLLPIVGDFFRYDVQSTTTRMLITNQTGTIPFKVLTIGADIATGQNGFWENTCPNTMAIHTSPTMIAY